MPTDKGEIEVTGRVNGMGEIDPAGSYAEFIIRDAEEVWTLSISEQQAIDIAVNIGRAWPEAVREAHAAGKAEGAAEERGDKERLMATLDTLIEKHDTFKDSVKHWHPSQSTGPWVRAETELLEATTAARAELCAIRAREGGDSDG